VLSIDGMSLYWINPDQISIQTLDQSFLMAAAQALMQGLCPRYSWNETRNEPHSDTVGVPG